MVLEAAVSTLYVRDVGVPRSLMMPLKSTSSKASSSQFGISKRRDRGRVERTKERHLCEADVDISMNNWEEM